MVFLDKRGIGGIFRDEQGIINDRKNAYPYCGNHENVAVQSKVASGVLGKSKESPWPGVQFSKKVYITEIIQR